MATQLEKDILEHRAVVSSFIIDNPNSDRPRVALFRRSDKVRTYQRKLAPISGSISRSDTSPFAAALRELHEETSLTVPKDLTLHLRGPSFEIADEEAGRRWTVHPFSFALRESAGSRINIDWEHTEYVWFNPGEILNGSLSSETVPRLEESLQRCWLGRGSVLDISQANELTAGMVLEHSLLSLKTDHESGAKQMANNVLCYFKNIVECLQQEDHQQTLWYRLRFVAWHLIYNGRESMNAAIASTLLRCLKFLSTSKTSSKVFSQVIEEFKTNRKVASGKIAEGLLGYLKTSLPQDESSSIDILTLSSSSTLQTAFPRVIQGLPDSCHVKLSILESRPLFEGVSLASQLLSNISGERLQVEIAPDSSISHLLSAKGQEGIKFVFLGADRISFDGAVSNKSGSLPVVLTARDVAKRRGQDLKVIVLSEVEKIAKEAPEGESDEVNDPAEISKAWEMLSVKGVDSLMDEAYRTDSRLSIVNKYFEWIPAELIDAYVTDDGILQRSQILRYSQEIAKLEAEIFADLSRLD